MRFVRQYGVLGTADDTTSPERFGGSRTSHRGRQRENSWGSRRGRQKTAERIGRVARNSGEVRRTATKCHYSIARSTEGLQSRTTGVFRKGCTVCYSVFPTCNRTRSRICSSVRLAWCLL